jgi:hypothetical protein
MLSPTLNDRTAWLRVDVQTVLKGDRGTKPIIQGQHRDPPKASLQIHKVFTQIDIHTRSDTHFYFHHVKGTGIRCLMSRHDHLSKFALSATHALDQTNSPQMAADIGNGFGFPSKQLQYFIIDAGHRGFAHPIYYKFLERR